MMWCVSVKWDDWLFKAFFKDFGEAWKYANRYKKKYPVKLWRA